jgi:diguanylate cyclase (GGDEF)-like protein
MSFAESAEPALSTHVELLYDVARIATQDLELRPMLQRITDALAHKFGWDFVALVTVDAERQQFVCEAVTSSVPTEVHPGYARALGSGVVGEVAATERPLLLDDVRGWRNYVETLPGAMSELCVPVRHGSQLVAILNLESTRLAAFRGQLPLLLAVADQIAPAIANARLYEELKRRARLMEMMSEISRAALAAADLAQLLQRVVDYIHRQLAVEIVEIVTFDEEAAVYVQAAYAGPAAKRSDLRWPADSGVTGRAIRMRKTQVVFDPRHDADYIAMNDAIRSELVVPIVHHGRVLGALNVECDSPDFFTPANVIAFEAFADQVAGAVHLASLKQELEEANERLQRLSLLDGLTGIANRRRFDEALEVEWRRGLRSRRPIALLLIDIDHFKPYNDSHGHQAGDDCLRRVAGLLRDSLQRAGDLVARYGGEEFAVLLPDTDAGHATRTAEMLRARIAEASPITISVGGTSTAPPPGGSAHALVAAADEALYEAKRSGRNRVVMR